MRWQDVAKTAARLAPALGSALGGPMGAAVGGLVANAYGTAATPDAVNAAITADPQAAVNLREIETRHAEAIAAMLTADVQHARDSHTASRMPAIVTIALAIMLTLAFATLVAIDIPAGSREAVMLIIGQITGAFAAAVAYWIGSSRGSALKQDMLDKR